MLKVCKSSNIQQTNDYGKAVILELFHVIKNGYLSIVSYLKYRLIKIKVLVYPL